MQASSAAAPTAFARRSTSMWVDGVIVAQLTKTFPAALVRRESPFSAKTASWAASSVMTVKMTSAAAVPHRLVALTLLGESDWVALVVQSLLVGGS